MLGFHFGLMNGWPSPALFLLTSDKSPLPTGQITLAQASWITSLKSIGMILGCAIAGILAKKFGRKWPLTVLAIPAIVRQLGIPKQITVYIPSEK